jgi:DoxX-like protein
MKKVKFKSIRTIIILLQISTVCVFLGRSWQHLVWDAPFRTLLWDEYWMKGIVENLFSIPWEDYITSPKVDNGINEFVKLMGWFYLICAFMTVMINKWKRVAGVFMIVGSITLIILAMLYCKERFFSLGQFFEYTLQFSSPLFLYHIVKEESIKSRLLFFMKLAIAFTFICHGLYAIGYYPRPGYFTEMTMNILGVEENLAVQFLIFAGIMDFVIGVAIFLPFRFSKWILLYAIFWGFFTTIARIWAYVELDIFLESAKQFVHESVYRVPHFMVPVVLYLLNKWKV